MLAVWSAECSADDPVLVVPWNDPGSDAAFVDLRVDPYDLDRIPEAEKHPPLMQALRALNATRSPIFTAKCDAWELAADEVDQLRVDLDLDAGAEQFAAGCATYIDMIWRDRTVFASFHLHEQRLHRLARHVAAIDRPSAALECILRPALLDFDLPQEGFAVSLYVKALGVDAHTAAQEWAAGLDAVVAVIRGKDLGW